MDEGQGDVRKVVTVVQEAPLCLRVAAGRVDLRVADVCKTWRSSQAMTWCVCTPCLSVV